MVAVDTVCIDEGAELDSDAAALLEAGHPALDADPDDVRARGLSDFHDAGPRRYSSSSLLSCSGHGEAYRLSRGSKH